MKFETSIFYDEWEYVFKVKSRSDDNGTIDYDLRRSKLSNGTDYDLLKFILSAFGQENVLPDRKACKYAQFQDIVNFLKEGNSLKILTDTEKKSSSISFVNIFEADKSFVYNYATGHRGAALVRAFETFGVDFKKKLIEEFDKYE